MNSIVKKAKAPMILSLSIIALSGILLLSSCNQNKMNSDASGVFESDEVIVSAQQNGQLLSFPIQEGVTIAKGAVVGSIDITNVELQKQQVQASIQALKEKTTNPVPQTELVKKTSWHQTAFWA